MTQPAFYWKTVEEMVEELNQTLSSRWITHARRERC